MKPLLRPAAAFLVPAALAALAGDASPRNPAPLPGTAAVDGDLSRLLAAGRTGGVHPSAADAPLPIPRSLLSAQAGLAEGTVEVFLETAPEGPGLPPDLDATPLGEGRHAARLSLPRLDALLAAGTVRSAALSRPLRPLLDRSAAALDLDGVRRPEAGTGGFTGATGRGVLVGVVDGGVDFMHQDFMDNDGKTRIYSYWDQGAPVGRPPLGYSFGAEWSAAEIDGGVAGGPDLTGHGTHVAGIAAGGGRAGRTHDPRYVGVAPGAGIVAVRTVYTEYAVALGVHYVFGRAAELGRPAVVNLSLGSHYGPHAGDAPFERALDNLTGPGRIVVAAAGNDAHRDAHAEAVLPGGGRVDLGLRFPVYPVFAEDVFYLDVEGWYDAGADLRFTMLDPSGEPAGSIGPAVGSGRIAGPRGVVHFWLDRDAGRNRLRFEVEAPRPGGGVNAVGTWRLRVESGATAEAEIDFWLVGWNLADEAPRFLDHVDREETLTVPSTARRVLAVGAVSTRACWPGADGEPRCFATPPPEGEVAYFSSLGPTADGRAKPEIAAPGFGIVSAFASTVLEGLYDEADLDALQVPGRRYWMLSGTSMASPHVAGALALLLERHPALTPEQAAGRLVDRSRAAVDPRTGRAVAALHVGALMAPPTRLLEAALNPSTEGIRIAWTADKELAPIDYVVYRGFSDEGPFHALAASRVAGSNPYSTLDRFPEPGRLHVYRIAAVDAQGLTEDLDTLRVEVPGRPASVLRPVDPNPARAAATVRCFLGPAASGRRFTLSVLDVRGRQVRALDRGESGPAGEEREVVWDLRDDAGRAVGAGVYWIRLDARALAPSGGGEPPGAEALVRKLVVLP